MATYAHPLLTDDDLVELTGYDAAQVRKQIKWLQHNRIAYTLRRDGRPRTTWGAVEIALAGRVAASEPDLSWI